MKRHRLPLSRSLRASAFALAAAAGSLVVVATLLAPPAQADVDDFGFRSYSADFHLDVDDAGRSTLRTVETFVAEFPDTDQNRGIQRAIPERYDGHPTDLSDVRVTDGTGAARPVDTESDDGFLVVTSASDEYVHGEQTYVFEYTQHNVTLADGEGGRDEFYWDTNGTAWAQPFESADARVHLSARLADRLTGDAACFAGPDGSSARCSSIDAAAADADGGVVIEASSGPLAAGENLTVAIGFEPGTFVPRDDSYFASWWSWMQLVAISVSLVTLVLAAGLRRTRLRDAAGRPTIVAEYEPPARSVFEAGTVVGKGTRAVAAAFVDLAVRGVIRIEATEVPKKKWAAASTTYTLRLLDPTGSGTGGRRPGRARREPSSDEREFVTILFGSGAPIGAARDIGEKDAAFGKAMSAFTTGRAAAATRSGLRRSGTAGISALVVVLATVSAVLAVVAGIVLLVSALGGAVPAVLLAAGVVAAVVSTALVARVPLTSAGAELRDHVAGLEEYIRLAEEDRLRVLQSVTGAERTDGAEQTGTRGLVGDESRPTVVDLYERLLPWAVLLGREKSWSEALAVHYEQEGTDPYWYSGGQAFNAAAFSAGIGSFGASVAASYAGSGSSSSSGGSGGGGSSGGGGGGGGGGGV